MNRKKIGITMVLLPFLFLNASEKYRDFDDYLNKTMKKVSSKAGGKPSLPLLTQCGQFLKDCGHTLTIYKTGGKSAEVIEDYRYEAGTTYYIFKGFTIRELYTMAQKMRMDRWISRKPVSYEEFRRAGHELYSNEEGVKILRMKKTGGKVVVTVIISM